MGGGGGMIVQTVYVCSSQREREGNLRRSERVVAMGRERLLQKMSRPL